MRNAQNAATRALTHSENSILSTRFGALPIGFVCHNFSHRNVVKVSLQHGIAALQPDQATEVMVSCVSWALLEQNCGAARKSSIVSVFAALWSVRRLFLLSMNFLQLLIHALFDGRDPLRAITFRALRLIGRKERENHTHDATV
jgi:hypothetical protein